MEVEYMGAISILVLGAVVVMGYFWRRRGFTGTKNVEEWGVSVDKLGFEPHFLGADSASRAYQDAVDLAEASLDVPIQETTAWRDAG